MIFTEVTMSKQTAVEWLVEELDKLEYEYDVEGISILDFDKRKIEIENQAKQMEKEQIEIAYDRKVINGKQNWFIGNGERYYNLHYMGNKKESNPEPNQNYTFEDGV